MMKQEEIKETYILNDYLDTLVSAINNMAEAINKISARVKGLEDKVADIDKTLNSSGMQGMMTSGKKFDANIKEIRKDFSDIEKLLISKNKDDQDCFQDIADNLNLINKSIVKLFPEDKLEEAKKQTISSKGKAKPSKKKDEEETKDEEAPLPKAKKGGKKTKEKAAS